MQPALISLRVSSSPHEIPTSSLSCSSEDKVSSAHYSHFLRRASRSHIPLKKVIPKWTPILYLQEERSTIISPVVSTILSLMQPKTKPAFWRVTASCQLLWSSWSVNSFSPRAASPRGHQPCRSMNKAHSPQPDKAESTGTLESDLDWNPSPATYLLSDSDKLLILSKF